MSDEFGVAPREEMLAMTGLEFLQAMVAGRVPLPPIAETLKYRLVEVGDGLGVFEGEPDFSVYNPLGVVHGGFALTLLDSCMGVAVHTKLPKGVGYTSVETKVNFVRPITTDTGPVRAVGRALNVGRTIGLAEGSLYDAAGKLLAHGTSTCAIFAADR